MLPPRTPQDQGELVLWCADAQNHEHDATAKGFSQAAVLETAQKCGFVKVLNAVDREALADIRVCESDSNPCPSPFASPNSPCAGHHPASEGAHVRILFWQAELLFFYRAAPNSPLLARLRPSDPVADITLTETAKMWLYWIGSYMNIKAEPWNGDVGRAMLDMPFAPPFNATAVTAPPLLMPIVSELLGAATTSGASSATDLGIALEQAAHIMVGPRTGPQQVHTDASHFSVESHGRAMHDVPALVSAASASDGSFRAAFEAAAPQMASGKLTYALNVQMPLQDVEMEDGPTALCPATHSESFCKGFLGGLCLPRQPGQPEPSALDTMAAYARSGLCAPGATRVHGTNRLGDVLLYDSRLIHWGTANARKPGAPRHVISFTYAHGWYTEAGRDLSPLAVEEAAEWRTRWSPRGGARGGEGHGTARSGAIGAARLKDIHNGMREMRDRQDRLQLLRSVLGWAFFAYLVYSYMAKGQAKGQAPQRAPRKEEGATKAKAKNKKEA